MLCELLSLINRAEHLLNNFFVGWVIVVTASELCQNDIFPEKEEEKDAYVLECMLTFDKMQNTSPLMCTKLTIWGQSILKVIQNYLQKWNIDQNITLFNS